MPGHGANGAYDITVYPEDKAWVVSQLNLLYGTTQAANYPTVADDLATIVPVQTGTSTIVVTLMSAATAGEGAIQAIEKVDTGKGQVRVVDDTGVYMGSLTFPGDRILCTPDEDGTGWHPILGRQRRWPPVSANIYPPIAAGVSPTGVASGSPAQDIIFVHPFEFAEPMYVDAIILNIGATSAAGLKFKTAMWAFNPATPSNPDGATLLSAGAEIGSAGTLTQQAYASALDTPQWVRRGWLGCKLNATPAVTNLVGVISGFGVASLLGYSVGRNVLGVFTSDPIKGWSYADAYANAMTTLGSGSIVTATTVPLLGLRAG
jgi:hypothetical protein